MKHLFFVLITLFMTSFLTSQVVINEYSASNLKTIDDNYGKTEDWIELYNNNDFEVDLSGYFLSDKKKKPEKWKIPSGTVIPANGFMIFWCSGRDEVKSGNFHTNFKLSQTKGKDKIIFSDNSGEILEKYDMHVTLKDHSYCRSKDGGDIWNYCKTPTPKSSNNNSKKFKSYTAQPTMSLSAGFYQGSQTINIINNESNSEIRYTLNGDTPSKESTLYSNPIILDSTTIIKARAFSNDSLVIPGKITFNTYFINEADFTVPVFSISSNDIEELANGNSELRPIGTLEYFNIDKEREAISYGEMNKHGQDSWILDHRSIDWISRDEMGYNKEIKAKLFTYSERDGYQRVMFRNSGDDNYPANDDEDHIGSTHIRDEYVQTLSLEGGMNLDTRAVRRIVLFINGKYWGLYGMREKPVDHDFTKEYYGQDKYSLHYLTTWGETKARYGGEDAFNDWYKLRDFVLSDSTGMSLEQNYNILINKMDILSLIDFFIANQNTVAKDWLNYNTAWWRGLDQEGTHKKWGYLLWDLDATFNYYINYTGIPNSNYNAEPCDIYEISKSMDEFFGEEPKDTTNPENCTTILNGSCPYSADDSIFNLVIQTDSYCCIGDWDETCQELYNNFSDTLNLSDTCQTILNGTCPYPMDDSIFLTTISYKPSCCSDEWGNECQEIYNYLQNQIEEGLVSGNVGQHEKIFIKLLEQNKEFKQLYYSRYADLMNTVYSCENMNSTLDRMLGVIRPEMPRQIERWGGSMTEWNNNVDTLKQFINDRCNYLKNGLVDCYPNDVQGPYKLVIKSEPEDIGTIKLNTIYHSDLPWEGNYYGTMKNLIEANINEEYASTFKFSHWTSTNGNVISPSSTEQNANISLNTSDTLIAVFEDKSSVVDKSLPFTLFHIYPNPAKSSINIQYNLNQGARVEIILYSILGEKISTISESINNPQGFHSKSFNLRKNHIKTGLYLIKMKINNSVFTKKIVVL